MCYCTFSEKCGVGYQARWRFHNADDYTFDIELRKCVVNLLADCGENAGE